MKSTRRGISPVISQIILAAAVLTVGGAAWYFALGHCEVTTNDYIAATTEQLSVATERFTVERVYNNTDGTTLTVCVNNYGDVDITIDIYAISATETIFSYDTDILDGKLKKIDLDYSGSPLTRLEDIQIKVYSRRQNIAYFYHTVH
jgi:hypothetical protein